MLEAACYHVLSCSFISFSVSEEKLTFQVFPLFFFLGFLSVLSIFYHGVLHRQGCSSWRFSSAKLFCIGTRDLLSFPPCFVIASHYWLLSSLSSSVVFCSATDLLSLVSTFHFSFQTVVISSFLHAVSSSCMFFCLLFFLERWWSCLIYQGYFTVFSTILFYLGCLQTI